MQLNTFTQIYFSSFVLFLILLFTFLTVTMGFIVNKFINIGWVNYYREFSVFYQPYHLTSLHYGTSVGLLDYYWPAKWASVVLLAGVCRRLSSSVTLPAGGRTGGPGARTVGRQTLHGGPVVLRPVRTTPCRSTVGFISPRMHQNSSF